MIDFLWKNIFSKEEKNTEEIIKANPLFDSLTKKELRLILKVMHQRSFVPGEFVFQPGKGLGMYIVLSGKVHIMHKSQEGNREEVIAHLTEGDFFGETALVQEKGHYSVSAQAVEPSTLMGFFRPDLMNLSKKSPPAAVKILFNLGDILGERLHKTGEKLIQLSRKMDP